MAKHLFLNFVFGFFEKIEYIGIERDTKKKEAEDEDKENHVQKCQA